jgi:hypothetical protein
MWSVLRFTLICCAKKYQRGERVADRHFNPLPLSRNSTLRDWNYALAPANGEFIFS